MWGGDEIGVTCVVQRNSSKFSTASAILLLSHVSGPCAKLSHTERVLTRVAIGSIDCSRFGYVGVPEGAGYRFADRTRIVAVGSDPALVPTFSTRANAVAHRLERLALALDTDGVGALL